PVPAHDLRPGDVFAFPDAPRTALTVLDTGETAVSPELTLTTLTLAGCDGPVSLPGTAHVRALRMVRTVTLHCLLCGKAEDTELDLPRHGEPLSLVCADHDPTAAPAA
ncbi:hypothetical protein, partial [Streptomyces javensis]